MSLSERDVARIVDALAVRLRNESVPAPSVIPAVEAARRAGFTSLRSFVRWTNKVGLRNIKGARGRYDVGSLNRAIERAAR